MYIEVARTYGKNEFSLQEIEQTKKKRKKKEIVLVLPSHPK